MILGECDFVNILIDWVFRIFSRALSKARDCHILKRWIPCEFISRKEYSLPHNQLKVFLVLLSFRLSFFSDTLISSKRRNDSFYQVFLFREVKVDIKVGAIIRP